MSFVDVKIKCSSFSETTFFPAAPHHTSPAKNSFPRICDNEKSVNCQQSYCNSKSKQRKSDKTMLARLLLVTSLLHSATSTCMNLDLDCIYNWSAWMDCDPCTHMQSRSLNISRLRHGSGVWCPAGKVEGRPCVPDEACPDANCLDGMFQCLNTGMLLTTELDVSEVVLGLPLVHLRHKTRNFAFFV